MNQTRQTLVSLALLFSVPVFGHTFGKVPRLPLLVTSSPLRTVGKMRTIGTDGARDCTATLVYKNVVVTSASCVIDPETKKVKTTLGKFFPNVIAGKALAMSAIKTVYVGTHFEPEKGPADNWALLVLEDNLGDQYGWMGQTDVQWTEVNLAGYDPVFQDGQTAGIEFECQIGRRSTVNGGLFHNCSCAEGTGAPLFVFVAEKVAHMVGVQTAQTVTPGETSWVHFDSYTNEQANFAVPMTSYLPTLKQIIKEQTAGE